jgi:hypothetical protein
LKLENKNLKTPKKEMENLKGLKDENKFTIIKKPKIKRHSIKKDFKEKINLRHEIEYEGNNIRYDNN